MINSRADRDAGGRIMEVGGLPSVCAPADLTLRWSDCYSWKTVVVIQQFYLDWYTQRMIILAQRYSLAGTSDTAVRQLRLQQVSVLDHNRAFAESRRAGSMRCL